MIQIPPEIEIIVRTAPRPLNDSQYEAIVNRFGRYKDQLSQQAERWAGPHATLKDIKGAVPGFVATRLREVCDSHDPVENPDFVAYVYRRFIRHCRSIGKEISRDGARIQMPPEVTAIVREARRPLDEPQYDEIVKWFKCNEARLRPKAKRWIGWDANDTHAKAVVEEFRELHLRKVCNGYKTKENPNFVAYLCLCLIRACWSVGEMLRPDPTQMQQPSDGEDRIERVPDPAQMQQPVDGEDLIKLVPDPSPASNPEEQAAKQQLLEAIENCLNYMPVHHREVIVLSFLEERSHKEIAQKLNCRAYTVRVRVFRAKAVLRDCLEAHGIDINDYGL